MMIFNATAKKIIKKIDNFMSTRSPCGWGAAGLLVLTAGVVIEWIAFPILLRKLVPNQIRLADGTDVRRHWLQMPIFDFKIYLFNITNPTAVKQGSKPVLQEIGPYCYKELKEKVEIEEDSEMDTISYRTRSTWIESQKDPNCGSQLTGHELLVVPNVPLLSILLAAEKDFPAPFLAAVNMALPSIFGDNSDLFLVASARTLLFGDVRIDCSLRGLLTQAVCSALRERSKNLKKLEEDLYSFSYLGVKNGSVDDVRFTVRRGIEAVAEVGRLVAVDGRPQLTYWRGTCNKLYGTDGSIFPPFRQMDNDSITAYSGEVCRVVYGMFEGQYTYKGISGYAYSATLGDTESNPPDKCFCPTDNRCYKKGVLDAFKCQGAPLVTSLPHFYQASDDYLEGVVGLHPDKNRHGIFVVLEPISGSPLLVRKRIQMNLDLKPIRFTPATQGLRRALVPLFWAEERLDLDGEVLNLLETSLLRPMRVAHVTSWLMVTTGAVLAVAAAAIKLRNIRRDKSQDPGEHFDYVPDFKQKLKYLESEETVVKGPFFIDVQKSRLQPRWGNVTTLSKPTDGLSVAASTLSIPTNTNNIGTKTIKYKRMSGLKEIMVKEKSTNSAY